MDTSVEGIRTLVDWRRRVAELYATVRSEPDPARGWRRWCDTRRELITSHPQSPITPGRRADFEGPFMFPHDPAARAEAEVSPVDPEPVEVGSSDGSTARFLRFGVARFELFGHDAALQLLWLDAYGGGLFCSFRDETSGDTTYGGGRYLLDTVKGADLGETPDGRLVLDFNFAYQPSCSYDPSWSCPLPLPENRLPIAVSAGERVGP